MAHVYLTEEEEKDNSLLRRLMRKLFLQTDTFEPEDPLTPQQLLENTYIDLAKKHGTYYKLSMITSLSGTISFGINGVDAAGTAEYKEDYSTRGREYYNFTFDGFDNTNLLARMMFNICQDNYSIEYQKELKARDDATRQQKLQEEAQGKLELDQKYMARYKELSGVTSEFNEHFHYLREIEAITKEQTELISKWNANMDKITDIRNKFYSLPN